MYNAILFNAITNTLLCKLSFTDTITRHIFINVFQTDCFSAVKFAMGYEKNTSMSFLVIPKSLRLEKKKVEKI